MTIRRIHSSRRMSQAVVHGHTIYIAGQVGNEGDEIAVQTRSALAEVDALLLQCGSDRTRLLSATIWLADMADFPAMNAVWDDWIDGNEPPARATGQAKLAAPGYKVEVIVVAAAPDRDAPRSVETSARL